MDSVCLLPQRETLVNNNIIIKKCCYCKEGKDINNFSKDKHTPNKYCRACKSCRSLKRKEYYKLNKESILLKNKFNNLLNGMKKTGLKNRKVLPFCPLKGYKFCRCCEQVLEETYFNLNKKNIYFCKICDIKKNKKYTENKKNKIEETGFIKITYKICNVCKLNKIIHDFAINILNKDGFTSICKECKKNYDSAYRRKDKNKEKRRIYLRWKRKTVLGNLDNRMSSQLRNSLRGTKGGKTWLSFVNYSLKDLKIRLESTFHDKITWDMFLKGNVHIDHIIPRGLFIYKNYKDEEFQKCWALDNLQALTKEEHKEKTKRDIRIIKAFKRMVKKCKVNYEAVSF